jgi:hypothetical protein
VGRRHTLVVVYYISKMISAAVMGLPHAHGVVGEVDIAVVALESLLAVGESRLKNQNLQKSASRVSKSLNIQRGCTYISAF